MICSWLLHPGSRWMPNVFISSEIGMTVTNYFGTPPADWVHGYLYFGPGAWIWTKGFRRYLHIVKNWSGKFSLNSTRVRALGWPLLGFFPGFFVVDFFEWGLWGKSFKGNIIIVFRGSNISCSLASRLRSRVFGLARARQGRPCYGIGQFKDRQNDSEPM